MAIAEWVLTGGLLAGIGYMCVRSLVSGGRRGRPQLLALRRDETTHAHPRWRLIDSEDAP